MTYDIFPSQLCFESRKEKKQVSKIWNQKW